MPNKQSSTDWWQVAHTVIGICIMMFGRYIPSPELVVASSEKLISMGFPQVDGGVMLSITPMGMTLVTLFAGVVYLWGLVNTLWPGFLGVVVLGFSGYAPMSKVLSDFLGNPMLVMIFFLLIFAAALIKSNVSVYFARWLMTHRIVHGRPWALTAMILVTTYLVAFFEQTTACFLIWPALYTIFEHAGYKKGDTYVSCMLVNTIIMALLSFATDPIKGGAFYLLSNMFSLAATNPQLHAVPLNLAAYLLFGFTISALSIVLILLTMRFVFRVDVSPLKNINPDILAKEELPPMNLRQKLMLVLFFLYAVWLITPGIIGTGNPVGLFMNQNAFAGSLMLVLCISFIHIDKKPLADICVTNAVYPWRIFFLIGVAFLLGSAMISKGTNVTIFMEYLLRGMLFGLSYTMLTVAVVVIGLVMTNFCNSVVFGLVLTPVLLAVCQAFEYSAGPILACFFYIVLVAACTPAASPFAAILYDNAEWIEGKDVLLHSVVSSVLVAIVVIAVGLPLAMVLFG